MLRARQLSRSRRSTGGPSIRGSWASWWRFEPALNGRRPPPRRRPPPPRPPPPTRGVRPNEAIPWPFGCELITTALQPARRHAATLPRAAAAPSRRTRSFPASPTSPRDPRWIEPHGILERPGFSGSWDWKMHPCVKDVATPGVASHSVSVCYVSPSLFKDLSQTCGLNWIISLLEFLRSSTC